MENTVVVLTSKSLDTMFAEGGSGNWWADSSRIQKCKYIVATRHANSGWSEDEQPHRSAFLVGKISGVSPSKDHKGRVVINMSEYAEINVPEVWETGMRNPVAYKNIEDLGIDVANLRWIPFPTDRVVDQPKDELDGVEPISINLAKLGIAKALGVRPENVEITIRA